MGSFEGAGFAQPSSAPVIAAAGERLDFLLHLGFRNVGRNGSMVCLSSRAWPALRRGCGAKSTRLFIDSCTPGLQERVL